MEKENAELRAEIQRYKDELKDVKNKVPLEDGKMEIDNACEFVEEVKAYRGGADM